jgi:DNA-binding response OmpR family regulator
MPKILVAEDDQDIRDLIALTLQFSGFDVESVTDGIQALERAQAERFDLILLDVRMPRMTGYEACRRLREDEATREIPIVFLSAKGQEEEIKQGLEAGAASYILKPFAPEALVRDIRGILDGTTAG